MATLNSSEVFSVGSASTAQEEVDIVIIAAPTVGDESAKGRLIHPSIGTYDYTTRPDEWGEFDADVIVPPTWQSVKTLSAGANTLWAGNIQDVEVYERWTSDAAMSAAMFRMLLSFYINPPTPTEYIEWYPNYINENGYKVILVDVKSGGSRGRNFNHVMLQNTPYIKGPVELNMRIVGYAD